MHQRPARFKILRLAVSAALSFAAPAFAALPPSIALPVLSSPASESGSAFEARFTDAKATVVVFLSSRCPCSQSHEGILKAIAEEFATKGVRFIGVHSNVDEDPRASLEHFKKASLPFPVLQDEKARIADAFGALKTPHVFVVAKAEDSGSEIVFQGGVTDTRHPAEGGRALLREALLAIGQGKKPEIPVARALGCVIQRTP